VEQTKSEVNRLAVKRRSKRGGIFNGEGSGCKTKSIKGIQTAIILKMEMRIKGR
jgi:hypothetical protein